MLPSEPDKGRAYQGLGERSHYWRVSGSWTARLHQHPPSHHLSSAPVVPPTTVQLSYAKLTMCVQAGQDARADTQDAVHGQPSSSPGRLGLHAAQGRGRV